MAKEKLGIMDLLAFAKAGYTPSDVKEILAMQTEETGSAESNVNATPEENVQKDETIKPAETQETAAPVSTSDAPDYKQMFEDQKKQIEELQANLQKAQSLNTTQNVAPSAPQLTGQELVNNIFKEVIF